MIEIIKDKEEWNNLINSTEDSDFYHSFSYHQISKSIKDIPILIKYTEENKIIGLPLLLRSIENSDYIDATSVYGYSGPITINIDNNFDFTTYNEELYHFFLEQKIVSVFSRLNPFIPFQEKCLGKLGKIETSGKIVNIDITSDLDSQLKNYNKRLKTYINKARRNCSVLNSKSKNDVLTFINLYYKNMTRVNAKKKYFFSKEYFFNLLNNNDFETELLLCVHNKTKKIIGGAMFTKKNKIIQYHLSGSDENYLDFYPIRLLIDEMRIMASNENYSFFNLGGGLGGDEDTLFQFKANFSKSFKPFKLWKYIVNENVYNDLVKLKPINDSKQSSHFFPSYRFNN